MNCIDVRKYFYAFIDGELDVEKNIEVLAHLNMCYKCSLRIERERLLQAKVKETVCKVKAPAYLGHKILRSAERRSNFFTQLKRKFLFRSRLVLLSGIATVIILIVCFFVIQSKLKKNDILYLAESKYHDYMMKHLDPDIRLQDTKAVMGRFQNQTGLSVTLPGIKENMHLQNIKAIVKYFQKQADLRVTLPYIKEDVQLVGAAFSKINGIKVPLVFYTYNGTPIALCIVCDSVVDFTKMKEVVADKMTMHTDTGFCGSCQIIGWKEAGNQYVMISTLPSEKMISMLTKV